MNDKPDFSDAFAAADERTRVESFAASFLEVESGAHRLEGAYYGSAGYQAQRRMKHSALHMTSVGELAKVVWYGVFRRTIVDEPDAGVPFITTSGMLLTRPDPHYYISRLLTDNLDDIVVREGVILVSRSGTVGNTIVTTSDFDGLAVSEDALRVYVNEPLNRGVVFALLRSDAGQFLLTRNKSGSVVEHLYESGGCPALSWRCGDHSTVNPTRS